MADYNSTHTGAEIDSAVNKATNLPTNVGATGKVLKSNGTTIEWGDDETGGDISASVNLITGGVVVGVGNKSIATLGQSNGKFLKSTNGGVVWSAIPNPLTTAGDIIVGGANGTQERLPKGTNGKVLSIVNGNVEWALINGANPSYSHNLTFTVSNVVYNVKVISQRSTAYTTFGDLWSDLNNKTAIWVNGFANGLGVSNVVKLVFNITSIGASSPVYQLPYITVALIDSVMWTKSEILFESNVMTAFSDTIN